MPPFGQPKQYKPTPEETYAAEYIDSAQKWANTVLRANERGALGKYVGKSYSKGIPIQFVGDSFYKMRKRGVGGEAPDKDEAAIVEGALNTRFGDVLKKAGTTFTDAVVNKLAQISPNPMDEEPTQLRYAINMMLGTNLEDTVRRKYQDGYKGQKGPLNKAQVDNMIKNIVLSKDYNDYEAFLNDRYKGQTADGKKVRYRPSDFNPLVYAKPILEQFLSPLGVEDVTNEVSGIDIPLEELQENGIKASPLTADDEAKKYYQKRRGHLMDQEFVKWKQATGRR